MIRWYAVYRIRDDALLACGTAKRCAAMLGFASPQSLYTMVQRQRQGKLRHFEIYFEDVDDQAEFIEDCADQSFCSVVLSPHVPQIRGMIQVNGTQRNTLKEVNSCGM